MSMRPAPRHRCRAISSWALVPWVGLLALSSVAQADERGVDIGIVLRFMPTGWFNWSGRAEDPSSRLRAYPALGGAPYVDFRWSRYASVGFMPELTLNVIPKVEHYPVSALLAGSLRLKLQYPDWHSVVPYLIVAPGYSLIARYESVGAGDGSAHGFVAGAYAGLRTQVSSHHALLVEAGYLHGFQKTGGDSYAPAYVVVGLGWQVSY
jgi:hypothetical protein